MHRRDIDCDKTAMNWWPDLSKRSDDTELMDSFDGDQVQLVNTLRQFRAINRWLTPCHRLINHHFLSVMKTEPNRRWTFLDLGAGGGDLPIWLVQRCNSLGIEIEITCVDYDPRVIDFLRQRCRRFPNISLLQLDAVELISTEQTWDFAFANHFLHHLPDDVLVTILRAIDHVTSRKYVLSDLVRSRLSYLAYSALLPLRMTNSFAWHDGRISIRKAFTVDDGNAFILAAGLNTKATVTRFFPGHLAIVGG
jgi:SAM-dependent methyltransferase